MRLNIAIPEENVSKPVLDAALESLTRLNEDLIRQGRIPPFREVQGFVRWQKEPPGQEHFDHGERVLARRWGDCDDLAPWHAASLRVSGIDPGAFAEVKRSGPRTWHAIVRRSDGRIEDPSLASGMPAPKGIRPAVLASMAELSGVSVSGDAVAMPLIAARPVFDRHGEVCGWDARADIPWHHSPSDFGQDVAMATLHRAGVPEQALVGALRGGAHLAELSELVSPDVVDRALAIADAIEGAEFEELEQMYGPDHAEASSIIVGDFFGDLANIASKVVSFVPGIGPIASMAIDAGKGIVDSVQAGEKQKAAQKAAMRAAKAKAKKKKKKAAARAAAPIVQTPMGPLPTGRNVNVFYQQ